MLKLQLKELSFQFCHMQSFLSLFKYRQVKCRDSCHLESISVGNDTFPTTETQFDFYILHAIWQN